ncbi:MAG TPA: DUF5668 domain-containing protein, partial [Roseiflexaceae bacterium]|nr:DUF5668 domain-containing protein [Roseiflexaceae bacterium]
MNAQRTLAERPERPSQRGGLVGPALLIGLGIVFLLNNLGYLGWGVWDTLFRLWPVLLIAVGLDLLIGRRSALGSALLALLILAGLSMAIWWTGFWLPSVGNFSGEKISQPIGGARSATIEIGMGIGQLHVGALSESDNLVEGLVAHASGEQIQRDFSIAGDHATFTVRSQGAWMWPFSRQRGERLEWNLLLNRDIPLRVQIDTGAGQTTLDLARLQVTALNVNSGVGQTQLTLPEHGRVQVRINGGVG